MFAFYVPPVGAAREGVAPVASTDADGDTEMGAASSDAGALLLQCARLCWRPIVQQRSERARARIALNDAGWVQLRVKTKRAGRGS